jgi:YVTN family beta-propeller protein
MYRIIVPVALALLLAACGNSASPVAGSKVYVADEESGTVTVLDHEGAVLDAIDLAEVRDGAHLAFAAHNVQAAPDGSAIWVAAAPGEGGGHGGEGHAIEQAIVIDPRRERIVGRVDLGTELHVAHVVVDAASRFAYVSANEASAVLQIDAQTREVTRRFELGAGRGPHGMRFCRDRLYVANMNGMSMSIVDPATGSIAEVPLGGVAVQTACTPDGRYVFASLYDTMEVIRYEIDTAAITRIALPEGSQGPVQLYPSPDSSRLYVCDQGSLLGRPPSNRLYEVDVASATVAATILVGEGAHGVVVSDDGTRAFVTNIVENTVSVVDTAARTVVATVPTGEAPNGIAHWHVTGGMP